MGTTCECDCTAKDHIYLGKSVSETPHRRGARLRHLVGRAALGFVSFAGLSPALISAAKANDAARADRAACQAPATRGPAVEEIRRLEEQGGAVNVTGWTIEQARAFFAPEWVSVQQNGSVTTLGNVLAAFVDGRVQGWAAAFTLVELDIRVYCDSAVVIGLAEARPVGAPPSASPARMRFLNMWRKQDGRWLYAANQWTRLP